MQITKELMDSEIQGMENRLAQAKASVSEIAGAITVLRQLRDYMEKPEPNPDFISEENAAIQERDQKRVKLMEDAELEALEMSEIAELVAGPGAVADEPEPLEKE